MTVAILLLLALGLAAAVRDWRAGVMASVLVGFLADPARKLLPGEPVYMVVAVGVVFALATASFLARHGVKPVQRLPLWRAASQPLQLFILWSIFAAVLTVARYHNPVLAGIGLMSYLAPVPALVLAYYYGRDLRRARTLLLIYVFVGVAMQIGTYLAFFGVDWGVLHQVGEGLVIYSDEGMLEIYSGFFRAPEVAAWHAAIAVCVLITLLTSRWIRIPYWLGGALIIFLLGGGLLTGRRKVFAVILLFVCMYGLLLLRYKRGTKNLLALAVLSTGLGVFALSELIYPSAQLTPYLQRSITVFGDAPDRLRFLGFSTIYNAISRFGVLGGGVGIASQGAQHFGGGDALTGGGGEPGLGKIALELGVPGLLLLGWIVVALTRHLRTILRTAARARPAYARMIFGIFALLIANVPAFMVASQVYGDLFVLLVLGLLLGFMLALASRAEQEAASPQRVSAGTTAATPPRYAAARTVVSTARSATAPRLR